jgi:uncharacterized protein YjiS (DUF1127 family)
VAATDIRIDPVCLQPRLEILDAFQVRGERQKLRAALFGLSDRELMDIGIARDEIDYIASHRSMDPRSG